MYDVDDGCSSTSATSRFTVPLLVRHPPCPPLAQVSRIVMVLDVIASIARDVALGLAENPWGRALRSTSI